MGKRLRHPALFDITDQYGGIDMPEILWSAVVTLPPGVDVHDFVTGYVWDNKVPVARYVEHENNVVFIEVLKCF